MGEELFTYSINKKEGAYTFNKGIKASEWKVNTGKSANSFTVGYGISTPSWNQVDDDISIDFEKTWDWVFLTTPFGELWGNNWEDWK